MLWQQAMTATIRTWLLAIRAEQLQQDTYQVPVVNHDGDVVQ